MESSIASGARVEGRYVLDRRLGDGTFGEVWAARDSRLSARAVAVKFLKEEHLDRPELVARFDAEADALALLQHPNVVAVLDRGTWERQRFLVTEFVEGEALSRWIARHASVGLVPDPGAVAKLFDGIAAGVEAAHLVRVPGPIVHRDLKPDNVLLRQLPGGEVVPKVLDFGIAQLGARQSTRTGMLMGTPVYMSPEQAMGQSAAIGPWTDVFALGVILVEMLTLRTQLSAEESWWGTVLQDAGAVRPGLAAMRADVAPEVWDVVARALRSRGADRFADAGVLRRAVQRAFAGQLPMATAATLVPAASDAAAPSGVARTVTTMDAPRGLDASGPMGTLPFASGMNGTLVSEDELAARARAALASGPTERAIPRTQLAELAPGATRAPEPGATRSGVDAQPTAARTEHAAPAVEARSGRRGGGVLVVGAVVALAGAGGAAYLLRSRSAGSQGGAALASAGASRTEPRPARDAAPASTAPNEPPGCTLRREATPVGARASVSMALNMGVTDSRLWLGWVVPSRSPGRGPDDGALSELDRDGRVLRVIDPEQPSDARGADQALERIYRVSAVRGADGALAARTDRWRRTEEGDERVECGPLASDLQHALTAVGVDGGASAPSFGAMYYCRTVPAAEPFVLGLRAREDSPEVLADQAALFATRGDAAEDAGEAWRVPVATRRVASATNPMAALRSDAIEGLAVLSVPSHGHLVMFRHRHRLQYGWLGEDLAARGALSSLVTLGGEPGRPRLAFNGREVVVVFADRGPQAPGVRETDGAAGTPYALYVSRAQPGGAFPPPARIETAPGLAGRSEFAPDVAALRDGGWIVAWSEGPTELRPDATETQRVLLRRYDPLLAPRGGWAVLSGARSASDPRLAVQGDDFVVAMLSGPGEVRGVLTAAGECR